MFYNKPFHYLSSTLLVGRRPYVLRIELWQNFYSPALFICFHPLPIPSVTLVSPLLHAQAFSLVNTEAEGVWKNGFCCGNCPPHSTLGREQVFLTSMGWQEGWRVIWGRERYRQSVDGSFK